MADTEVERIRLEYLQRLRHMLRRAPADIREDAVREVQAHIEDEWQALGGDLSALQAVLQRLGPPEEYGKDLALQLMLAGHPLRRSPVTIVLASFFWASTSLAGAVVILIATLVALYAVGMVFIAVGRLAGYQSMLINVTYYQFFGYRTANWIFPPQDWSSAVVFLAGVLPIMVIYAGLDRFTTFWLHSRLAERGLDMVRKSFPEPLPHGWERRATWAVIGIAFLGLASCTLFSILSNMIPIGQPGRLDLPADFFRVPVGVLAFLGLLVFLGSPLLGLLWTVRRTRRDA